MADTGTKSNPDSTWWNPIDDIHNFLINPITHLFDAPFHAIDSWLGSLGGQLASGLERGGLAIVEDIWRTILPGVQIIAGVVIVIVAALIGKDMVGGI